MIQTGVITDTSSSESCPQNPGPQKAISYEPEVKSHLALPLQLTPMFMPQASLPSNYTWKRERQILQAVAGNWLGQAILISSPSPYLRQACLKL